MGIIKDIFFGGAEQEAAERREAGIVEAGRLSHRSGAGCRWRDDVIRRRDDEIDEDLKLASIYREQVSILLDKCRTLEQRDKSRRFSMLALRRRVRELESLVGS